VRKRVDLIGRGADGATSEEDLANIIAKLKIAWNTILHEMKIVYFLFRLKNFFRT
jgi:hypothetical protein